MIIFSGHGILIPIFAIAGAFAGHYLSDRMHLDDNLSFVIVVWSAAIAVLLYALTLGKTRSRTLIDPENNRNVEIKKRHTLFFLPAIIWAFALCGVATFFTFTSFTADKSLVAPGPGEKSAGEIAFDAADLKLSKDELKVQGNSPEAEALAQEMLDSLVELRDAGVRLTDERAILGDSLKIYCQLSDERCAFLVMESALGKYTEEGREFLSKAAWMAATATTLKAAQPPGEFAIGIRGLTLYEGAWLGAPDADFTDIVKYHGTVDRRALFPFFGPINPGDKVAPPPPKAPIAPMTDDSKSSPDQKPTGNQPSTLNSTSTPPPSTDDSTIPAATSGVSMAPVLDFKLLGGNMNLTGRLRSEYQIKDIAAALGRSKFSLTNNLAADSDTKRVDWGNRVGPLLAELAESVPDLHFHISEGAITITGTVKDAAEKNRLQRAISYVFETSMDITALNNELQTP